MIMLATVFFASLQTANAQKGQDQFGVNVAVLPFEVFSIEKEPDLGAEIAELITKQLALNPAIICVNSQQVKTVLESDGQGTITEDRLRQTAKLLNANYIIMGTVTKIRAEHSIDVEILSTTSRDSNFKTYAEGLEIKSLIETVTTALDQQIMEKSEWIPTSERPRVTTTRQPSPDTPAGGFDVERELVAAYGPEQQPRKTDAVPTPQNNTPSVNPTLTEEPLLDAHKSAPVPEPQTTTAPASQPSALEPAAPVPEAAVPEAPVPETPVPEAPVPEAPVPEKNNARQPEQKKPEKDTKDPGFFTLSKAINIKSDTMEYDNRANKAIFKGNVVARQDDIVMFANTMHVYYEGSDGLSKIDARGNVRVVQGDRVATGSRIIFNNANKTIVATGSPRVWQGDNVVHGGKITVYLKEERTVVEGAIDSRASATIYPEKDTKKP